MFHHHVRAGDPKVASAELHAERNAKRAWRNGQPSLELDRAE